MFVTNKYSTIQVFVLPINFYKIVLLAKKFFVKKQNNRFSSELVKTHIEEVKKLLPHIKRGKSDYIVKYLGVAYDDFRKEVLVSKFTLIEKQ